VDEDGDELMLTLVSLLEDELLGALAEDWLLVELLVFVF